MWTTNSVDSNLSIDVRANVCCVQFNPVNSNILAVGSAAHSVLLYDLRYPRDPVHVFQGHEKAVSYVRFVNADELVSASTDNSLRLWDCRERHCLQTFRGHMNEKNFVGLATNGQFLVCGSETNELYMYCKGIQKPLIHHSFSRPDAQHGHHFVSTVAWRKRSNTLLAANSLGSIWMLGLV